ncbi:Mo-dependent nitrogenase C-terminal domain-containing protein [Nodularia spumigena CS-588/02]|uniref:Mo-dependent nitrogenase C-terminal domain-containing protein n=1 Tax=Nodularia spumigena TaxID=70799 RepID=UPI00232C097E|nr:Mo-dependent nitrogenase C-terminal domain-containing protein [Nodularia spumigena]MDB9326416.1 Mo-dependent nitrogenase C-terminal domain-containing protein [Nodularia spumigena CS-590/02]MDB9350259.1 Mo-dependent nitrogenase C-terminal domain-containing protein [Nodularia spumigena CS-588/01]MDB9350774.1 Mo-dependent nitrogenase C-terminal domain-containing protein [Nodularia spumigena CS-588/05]MDB9361340.1 Mo-dependent nitrogenase C-terminal domain-containing protein [Nodularia spumigena
MESINHTHSHPNYHPPNNKKSGWFHNLLKPVRNWLDGIPVKNSRLAHVICQVIPCCCPFERNISLFGRTLHIPPLCKLNPLYDEFVGMRFRALSYLADECGEDVTKYIC